MRVSRNLTTPSNSNLLVAGLLLFSAVVGIILALSPSAHVHASSTGLVASYSFNEGVGTTVTDSSGNGNNGTISGATWTTAGKYGSALSFNGTSSRVVINDSASLHLSSGMTLEAWVSPTTAPTTWQDVIYKQNDIYFLEAGSSISKNPPAVGATFSSHGDQFMAGLSSLPAKTWTHLAATYDGATLLLYVNGVQVASRSMSDTLTSSTNALQIGGDAAFGQYFNGIIDEVRIYNRALAPAEIQSDMAAPISQASQAAADRQSPTGPANLTATSNGPTQINLSWTASTDNAGVTGYLLQRCLGAGCTSFSQTATPTGTTYSNTGLTPSTSYSYRVRATDAAGNLSSYSNVATLTTPAAPDTTPPTAPSNLSATSISTTQVNLSWTASTDNVGVTAYLLERCLGAGCTSFAQIATSTGTTYSNTGLAASTSYSYRVRATDAAGNLSVYSNIVSAVTPAATSSAPAAVSFVQSNYATPQSSQTSVTVPFPASQIAGDLNVVVMGWNNSSSAVNSVSDSSGNVYSLAVGPTQVSGALTQSIYYAKNIIRAAPNANVLTVKFNGSAASPDIRILEYSGLNTTSPFDAAVGASGQSASSATPSVAVPSAGDLILGANIVLSSTTGPGSSFTQRILTSPDGDIVEDRIASTAGSYSASAPLSASAMWIMQMVAFKAATTAAPASPALVSIAVTPTSPSLSQGSSLQFTATGTFSDKSTQNITASATWTSSNSSVATIGASSGLAKGASTGSSQVSATQGGISSPATTLTVSAAAVAPTITTQPANQTVTTGQTATFSVSATGTAPLTYQWSKNGSNIVGATSSSYTTPATTSGDNGSTFQVVVSNTAGNTPSSTATLTVTSSGGGPASAALVQHVSSSNTRNNTFSSPFCYHFQLPNLTTAGNALVVSFTFNGNSTPSVSDDKGDSFSTQVNFYDSTDTQSIGIATAFNIAAGARVVSVCFNADPGGYVQPMATEFDNVIGIDVAGSGSNGSGTSVTAGGLTPTTSGDLAYQVAFSLSVNQSSFAAGSQSNISWNLLSADLLDGWAAQFGLYNSTSAINPTLSMGTSQKWISAAVLLKTGSSGAVPSGMRIVHLVHENIPEHTDAGGTGNPFPNPTTVQFPSSGNLLVAMIGGGYLACTVTSVADSNNNAWAQAGATQIQAGNDVTQAFYAGNATTSGNLTLTVHWSATDGDFTFFLYDVTGAAASPLDTTGGATGAQSNAGNLTMPFTITPAGAGELLFTEIIWDYNTGSGLAGSGWLFDTNTFSGESQSGPEPIDQNNGWGHYITTSNASIPITWIPMYAGLPTGNWSSVAVAFKPAP
jgi:chitodextrinase